MFMEKKIIKEHQVFSSHRYHLSVCEYAGRGNDNYRVAEMNGSGIGRVDLIKYLINHASS